MAIFARQKSSYFSIFVCKKLSFRILSSQILGTLNSTFFLVCQKILDLDFDFHCRLSNLVCERRDFSNPNSIIRKPFLIFWYFQNNLENWREFWLCFWESTNYQKSVFLRKKKDRLTLALLGSEFQFFPESQF